MTCTSSSSKGPEDDTLRVGRLRTKLVMIVCVAEVLLFLALIPLINGQVGDAEVTRNRKIDVAEGTALRKLGAELALAICATIAMLFSAVFPLAQSQSGNVEIAEIRNFQFFQLEGNNVDVTRYAHAQHTLVLHVPNQHREEDCVEK